jgi:drug/metabolite transporter (DMT)-like permease
MNAPRLDGKGWAFLFSLALLWSISFVFIKVAAEKVPVLTLVLVRVGLAALVLHAVILLTGRIYPARRAVYGRFAVMGLMNNVLPFALIVFATARIGAGAASILNATAPIFTLIVAHLITVDEKITPRKIVGILLGVAGVVAMAGPQAAAGLTGDLAAVAAMLVACFFYGISAIYGRGFGGIDATVSAACQLTASAILLLPMSLVFERPWEIAAPGGAAIASVLALAILSTAIAYVIYYALIQRAGATNTILVTLLIPAGGVFFAWMILGEALTLDEIAGMLLIGLGLVVIDGRVLRYLAQGRRSAGDQPAPQPSAIRREP